MTQHLFTNYHHRVFDDMANKSFGPFEELHKLTTLRTMDQNSFRFLTYNILSDLYAFRDIADYTPYCSAEHLALAYRQNILIEELKGYNSDILCLQEVDEKVFNGKLTKELKDSGLEGIYLKKHGKLGELTEGPALYYRTSKFRLLNVERISLTLTLETASFCSDIKEWAYQNPTWKTAIEIQPHVAQIAMFECQENGRTLIVCNTHVLWDESKPIVRFVQVLVTIRLLEQILQKNNLKEPGLIYCGDFNSRPDEAVIQFILNQDLRSNIRNNDSACVDDDWMPKNDHFSHSLNLNNACGIRPYTSLTMTFKGHIDYIFYEHYLLEVARVIPQLGDSIVTRNTAIPNVEIPSDHLPQICEFRFVEHHSQS